MKLQQFRVRVARLTRPELSQLADVSIATIQRAEKGETVSELTAAKLLAALSQRLGREVKQTEIEDLKVSQASED
jgi:DNA-binding XRE family transcriptional regulator